MIVPNNDNLSNMDHPDLNTNVANAVVDKIEIHKS